MTTKASAIVIAGRRLRLANLDKVFYPATGTTKGQVVEYYRQIAPLLLRHLRDYPLTLKRYPDGVEGGSFYEKRCPSHRPEWVATADDPAASRPLAYCLVKDEATLVWVANLASIELHVLLSRAQDIDTPTMMVFDLDPGAPAGLLECVEVALLMRDMLQGVGLESFPKSSGGKGLHFYVPLNTPATFEQTKQFARTVAQTVERRFPQTVTSSMSKALRPGKVFIDWSQNDRHKTTVCVYSLRAREQPTVSTPLKWRELEEALRRKDPAGLVWDYQRLLQRVGKEGDLFEPVQTLRQRLPGQR